ncbi:NUDIX domain-containing protein [Halomonas halocynthiae]|uniref:NUDIX domain-containing protein n=1 Tax=Halomonas halocynthiae TaxID=176290 RepID=UPI0004125D1D|nr:NUDIX domain-containing protein [Halomonas halocynthiae]
MRWQPFTTVATVIEQGNRFLMVEERHGPGATLFTQPAGHLELGESIRDGALREVREESAWEVDITHYLGLYVFQAADKKTFHSHGFRATPLYQINRPLDPAVVAAHWLTLEEIEQLAQQQRLRSQLVIQRIRDTLAGRFYPADVIHEFS